MTKINSPQLRIDSMRSIFGNEADAMNIVCRPVTGADTHSLEAGGEIAAPAADVFAVADRHARLSSHMTGSSWMMGGGRMDMTLDSGGFQRLGSHLRLAGRAFGVRIFLDEVVTHYQPPLAKTWETVGAPRLLIIGAYRMGFILTPAGKACRLRIFIDYEYPRGGIGRVFAALLATTYARWCVRSMLRDVKAAFSLPAAR